MKRVHGSVLALVVAGLSSAASAGIELADRYVDPKNGFSICPPLGAEQKREFSPARLVQWQMRDAKTGAISWTLTVRREGGPARGDMKAFAAAVKGGLEKTGEFSVEAAEPTKLLGHDALEVRAQRGDAAKRWQRETWVVVDPNTSLVVAVAGPLGMKEHLDAAGSAAAGTLRLLDVKSVEEQRQANLARGRSLLGGLTAEKLSKAAAGEARWYLYRRGGEDIGYMRVASGEAKRDGAAGVEVKTFARLDIGGGQVMHLKRDLWASADRKAERWEESVQVYAKGRLVRKMNESGSLSDGTVACRIVADKVRTVNKALPAAMAALYLPRAMAMLLPRLAPLDVQAGYGFATFTTAGGDFDLQTFTVQGKAEVTIGSRTLEAVAATDQVAADKAPVTEHLLADGTLLRMQTGDGVVMEQSTAAAVQRRWAEAAKL